MCFIQFTLARSRIGDGVCVQQMGGKQSVRVEKYKKKSINEHQRTWKEALVFWVFKFSVFYSFSGLFSPHLRCFYPSIIYFYLCKYKQFYPRQQHALLWCNWHENGVKSSSAFGDFDKKWFNNKSNILSCHDDALRVAVTWLLLLTNITFVDGWDDVCCYMFGVVKDEAGKKNSVISSVYSQLSFHSFFSSSRCDVSILGSQHQPRYVP